MFARHDIHQNNKHKLINDINSSDIPDEFLKSSVNLQRSLSTQRQAIGQSIGQSERAKQTCSRRREITKETHMWLFLEYRNAPLDGVKLSPAKLLMGRHLKTKLPATTQLLKPQLHKKVHK